LEALTKITVPLPPIEKQIWFDKLQQMTNSLKRHQAETQKELDALMPSILDKAFKGDL
jgi:type I restriction enzyme S subunit